MVQVQQRLLIAAGVLAVLAGPLGARRFYEDDPIAREPAPLPVANVTKRKINEYYDFFQNTFWEPDKGIIKSGRVPRAGAVNTLGEVPDSSWYQNREVACMTVADLVRGPGTGKPPAMDRPWTVISGKNEGITPGFLIEDARGRRFYIKFDPKSNPEMASAADVIGSKFFYALGYNVPENYIVRFNRRQLRVGGEASVVGHRGRTRAMAERDVDDALERVPRDYEGNYRALASLAIAGDLVGPFRYYGTRKDDPNDVVPHEDRRDLRGLYVFAAWLNHTDSKSINSLDSVVEENGLRFIKHYLIDFGAILGSDSFEAKSPRAGNVYLFDFKPAAIQFLTLGLDVPAWQRASYPHIPAVGRFESAVFDPERWKSNYPNPAFDSRLPGDTFWAARKVMAFTDEQIRALVETGEYSDPRAVDWVARNLAVRRDKIGRAFFDDVLPLDNFAVHDGRLAFEDLAVKHGFAQPRAYEVHWSRFDNVAERASPVAGAGLAIPRELLAAGQYAAAEIRSGDPRKTVTVYLLTRDSRTRVVGIDRAW